MTCKSRIKSSCWFKKAKSPYSTHRKVYEVGVSCGVVFLLRIRDVSISY